MLSKCVLADFKIPVNYFFSNLIFFYFIFLDRCDAFMVGSPLHGLLSGGFLKFKVCLPPAGCYISLCGDCYYTHRSKHPNS